MAHFSQDDVVLARVLHEDDQLMTLEVIKDMTRVLDVDGGDRFFTLIFTHGKPWDEPSG